MSQVVPKPRREPCNDCQHATLHDVLYEKEFKGSDEVAEEFTIDWSRKWRLLQCRGCESVSLRKDNWHSEMHEDEVDITYFPPRTFRSPPIWLNDTDFQTNCPEPVEPLINELYVTLQNDCPAASTMLMRAIFEHVMISKVSDQGSFAKNLTKFAQEGHISTAHAKVIDTFLDAGHASMHRAYVPKRKDLVVLADILESILEVLYVQAPQAAALHKRIPKRKKRINKPKTQHATGLQDAAAIA